MKKENPKYIDLLCKIEQKQARIDSRTINNPRTLRYAKAEIKIWKKQLKETQRYINEQ